MQRNVGELELLAKSESECDVVRELYARLADPASHVCCVVQVSEEGGGVCEAWITVIADFTAFVENARGRLIHVAEPKNYALKFQHICFVLV